MEAVADKGDSDGCKRTEDQTPPKTGAPPPRREPHTHHRAKQMRGGGVPRKVSAQVQAPQAAAMPMPGTAEGLAGPTLEAWSKSR